MYSFITFQSRPIGLQVQAVGMNRGVVGASKLNDALQDALNPSGFEITRGGRRYRVGDKVMQIKNNYDKNVFNGDIGVISHIDSE
jgi:exodeoxyribonuclease V alpha subunit